ncbi:MAG: phosphotransferase [Pirellulales bacterium]|nr:phosphotransferase [Pirellulales bacterium]
MNDETPIRELVTRFWPPHCLPSETEFLGSAGGFSGARFWRWQSPAGHWCLRQWPLEHPTPSRLQLVHSVLRHAGAKGFTQLPLPVVTASGESFVRWRGHLWELTPWLPGRADFHDRPTSDRLVAALETLARFHVAVADFEPHAAGPSPGLAERREWTARLLGGELELLRRATVQCPLGELGDLPARILGVAAQRLGAIQRELRDAQAMVVPLQPAIRDIWHDHVLFADDRVAGIVDFGALRFESVAGDVARLTGSLVGNDRAQWQTAMIAYERLRPLSEVERALVSIFDRSGVVLSGLSWIQWLFMEDRQFEDLSAVRSRLMQIVARLER